MAGGLGRGEVAGGLGVHRMGLENMELNADSAAAASYPNMSMYTHLLHPGSASGHGMPLQRTRSDIVPQRQGRPPRQGLPPLRAPNRRGKQVVATSGRGGAGSSRSGSGRQQQAPPIMVDDVEEEYEEEKDDSMLNQHMQNEDESSDEDSMDQDDESSDEDRTDQDDESSDEEEEDTRTNRVLALLQLRRQRLNKLG
ncbi:unnamed protein product [Urochloa humidicola]